MSTWYYVKKGNEWLVSEPRKGQFEWVEAEGVIPAMVFNNRRNAMATANRAGGQVHVWRYAAPDLWPMLRNEIRKARDG